MYLRFYDLKRNIFQFSTNPDFTWIGDKLERTLSQLEGDLVRNPGVYQLIGGIGTGKSTLAGILIGRLPKDFISAEVSDSSLNLMDLLNYLSIAFEIGKRYRSKEEFQPDFEKFLARAASRSQKVLIVIDESQALPPKMPCHLQWLMGLDSEQSPVLSILLVGQKDLRKNGTEEENPLASEILATLSVVPLDLSETTEYIQESLKYAGADREIFTLDAIQAVYQLSHGVLRNVNILCDNTMIAAHFRKEKEITRARVKASGVDFDLSSDSVVAEEPPVRKVAKKLHRPVLKTVAKTIGATLSLVLVAGGIYVYHSIELIPEMEPVSSVVKTRDREIESRNEKVSKVKTVAGNPVVTEKTADNNRRITANESKVYKVPVLHQDKTKKIVHAAPEQREIVAEKGAEFQDIPDGPVVNAALSSGNSRFEETVAVTDDQPGVRLSNVSLSASEREPDVQPYTDQGDFIRSEMQASTPPEPGVLNTSTSRIETLTGKAPLRDPEKLQPPATLTDKSQQSAGASGLEKTGSAITGGGVGPRNAHLVEPKLGIGPGMVSLNNIPTPVQPEKVSYRNETGQGEKSGQQTYAGPQPKVTRQPPLEKKGDGQLVYKTMASEDTGAADITVANHTPPASKFEDDDRVQAYTPPEEEEAEEIDPGDVIDWLIKKRQKQ